jgi:hypothetical protein
MIPGEKPVLAIEGRFHVDHRRRPKIRPGEFLFARPSQHNRLACVFGDAGRFDGAFAGVLAAIGAAKIRYDHANVVVG